MSDSAIQTYLLFHGRCEEAIAFYQKALGAEVEMMLRYHECPEPMPEGRLPAGYEEKIMHASFRIRGSTVMASDGCGGAPGFEGFSLALNLKTEAEVDETFNALAESGKVDMPPAKTFWTTRFAMVTDQFGVGWMLSVMAG